MKDWSAGQYLKFEDERTRPARDLLAQVPLARPQRVADLGCGPGNSTALLVERFPDTEVIGLDSSPDMLRKARERLPECSFIEADVTTWTPDPRTDLLFANAVFQWVPDHLALLCRFLETLPQGAALAVQMPDNLREPYHRLMREVASEGPWAARFATASVERKQLPDAGAYYDRLVPLTRKLDIWSTVYQHPLDDAAAIVEWVKGTGLRPYLARLEPAERQTFLAAYSKRIAQAYTRRQDGKVLLRYPRLFIVAVR